MTTSTNAASFALLSLLAAGCVGPWPNTTDTGPTEPTGPVPLLDEARVAFVFPGPVGDHGSTTKAAWSSPTKPAWRPPSRSW
jgi:hypothetical protein